MREGVKDQRSVGRKTKGVYLEYTVFCLITSTSDSEEER